MTYVEIGRCSQCGGSVQSFQGAWGATVPPPPAKCVRCGAIPKVNVIETVSPNEKKFLVE